MLPFPLTLGSMRGPPPPPSPRSPPPCSLRFLRVTALAVPCSPLFPLLCGVAAIASASHSPPQSLSYCPLTSLPFPRSVSALFPLSLSSLSHLRVMWLLREAWRQEHAVQCLGKGGGGQREEKRERARERERGREYGDLAPCLPHGCQEAHICL